LKSGNHRNATFGEIGAQPLLVDRLDARFGERAVGQHAHLGSGVAFRFAALVDQRHREQADGDLLAGGRNYIELARVGLRLDLLGEREQSIGLARHRRRHDHDVMPHRLPAGDPLRDVADTLDVADRRAAELLYDQCHGTRCEKARILQKTCVSRFVHQDSFCNMRNANRGFPHPPSTATTSLCPCSLAMSTAVLPRSSRRSSFA
jgi:hypothetical protein